MRAKNRLIFKIKWIPSFPMALRPLSKVQKPAFEFSHFWRFAAQKSEKSENVGKPPKMAKFKNKFLNLAQGPKCHSK